MSQRKTIQAFTVIELLVVIGAITILVGILFVSIGFVHRSMKERQTRAQLGNLKGMLVELDSANGLKNSPPGCLWWNGGAIVNAATDAQGYSSDFWRSPWRAPNTAAGTFDVMNAPGIIADQSSDGPGPRNGSPAIVNTTIAMSLMTALPANRTRLQNIAQAQTFIPTRMETGTPTPLPFNSTQTTDVRYIAGAQVQYGGRFWIASGTLTTPGNPTPGGSPQWLDAAGRTAPMLLDGWGNPIIFVPASGLRVHLSSLTNPTDQWIVVSPEGRVQNNGQVGAQVVQIGRPFFASAGPDGSFEKGDDNVYSFDQ